MRQDICRRQTTMRSSGCWPRRRSSTPRWPRCCGPNSTRFATCEARSPTCSGFSPGSISPQQRQQWAARHRQQRALRALSSAGRACAPAGRRAAARKSLSSRFRALPLPSMATHRARTRLRPPLWSLPPLLPFCRLRRHHRKACPLLPLGPRARPRPRSRLRRPRHHCARHCPQLPRQQERPAGWQQDGHAVGVRIIQRGLQR